MTFYKSQIQDKLHNYNNFLANHYSYLKSKNSTEMEKFKSHKSYNTYMMWAISDLGLKNPLKFFEAKTRVELEKSLKDLKCSNAFRSRPEKQQSDIISAFKAYMEFQVKRFMN